MLLGSSNFLVPNATFIVELVAFLVVLGVLAKYILPYISKPMEERQATIRQALTDAEEASTCVRLTPWPARRRTAR